MKKGQPRSVFRSIVGLKASLVKKNGYEELSFSCLQRYCAGFYLRGPDQDVIGPSDCSEGNSIVADIITVSVVRPSWLSPMLLKQSHTKDARERHEQVGSHGPKYFRRVRIGNSEKFPRSDD